VLVVTRAICRVRVDGGERIPLEGGALLVCRPMGFLWAAGLVAITQRRIRFIADPAVFRPHPGLRFLMPLLGVIPIALGDTPRRQVEALRAARRALEEGFLVGVFAAPERFAAFESMFQRLMDGGGISVLPVRADARSDAGAGRPGFRRSVNLQIGERLPPETSAATVWAVLGSDPTGAIKTEAASDGPAPGAAGAPGGEA